MIKNEYEYKLTQEKINNFRNELEVLSKQSDMDQIDLDLYIEAYMSQIDELQSDLELYESLTKSKDTRFEVNNVELLPETIVKARIARGISEDVIAEKLGINEKAYKIAENEGFDRLNSHQILNIIDILDISITDDIDAILRIPMKETLVELSKAGFDLQFFKKKLSYKDPKEESALGSAYFVQSILNIFKLPLKTILGDIQLDLGLSTLNTRYKLPKNANKDNVSFYTAYAHHIGKIALKTTSHIEQKQIPNNPRHFYMGVIETYGEFNFENVLRFAWDLGVCILPLNDKGAFHGAFWRIDHKNLIVLKQKLKSQSRWQFDILHELWHAAEEPELDERTVIDYEDIEYTKEEEIANKFAANIILKGNTEKLVKECEVRSKGKIELLKYVVQEVAKEYGVSVGGLANYLAHRLSAQNIFWWGAANNLQTTEQEENPFEICRDVFLEYANLGALSDSEQYILLNALYDVEE